MHQSAAVDLRRVVEECTGIPRSQFPLKYLGFPITHARKRKEHYANLIRKVRDKLQAWKELHRIFAKFFWSNNITGKSKHWAAWDKVCLPKIEGGLELKSPFGRTSCHDPSLGPRRDMTNEEPEGTPNKPLKLVITLHRSRKYIQH
ncbi:hypothetical protein KY289_008217 [Solanum tuberosum]|nr:hypothetical protein KY289_008217 [Solanum tuberosum]